MDCATPQRQLKPAARLRVRIINTIFEGVDYLIQQVSLPEFKKNAILVIYEKKNDTANKI